MDTDIFDALIHLIGVLSDKKFHNFRPVLDAYIQRHFSGAMVHRTLTSCLRRHVDNVVEASKQPQAQQFPHQQLRASFKALEYIFKLIVQSRVLFQKTHRGGRNDEFKMELRQLFISFNNFVGLRPSEGAGANVVQNTNLVASQNILLLSFSSVFSDLNKLFTMGELGVIASEFLRSIVVERGKAEPKLKFIHSLVKGELFRCRESRTQLFPAVVTVLREQLDSRQDLDVCLDVLHDTLNVLYGDPTPPPAPDAPNQYDDLMQVTPSLVRQCLLFSL